MKKKLLLLGGMVSIMYCSHAQWQLTGNAISSGNFLGTTNAQPLVFKVNNNRAGFIDFDNATSSVALGYQALNSLTSGYGNSVFGFRAMYGNTSGSYNSAFGQFALVSNTTGYNNVACGASSMWFNSTGHSNIGIGAVALMLNSTGSWNVAIGETALQYNETGNYNVAVGYLAHRGARSGNNNVAIGALAMASNQLLNSQVAVGDSSLFNLYGGVGGNTAVGSKSLFSATTASYNTAHGYQSLYSVTSGDGNTATGYQSLYTAATGRQNTAVGYQALFNNQDNYNTALGYQALFSNTYGWENTAVGHQAMYSNQQSYYNTAVGSYALYNNVSGGYNTAMGNVAMFTTNSVEARFNTAIGLGAMYSNVSGGYNTAMGSWAMSTTTTGVNNTAVGYGADISVADASNTTVIGYWNFASASNQVRIGNGAVTSIGGYANWTNLSDKRFKKNVQENVPGLQFINALRPVTYTLDLAGIEQFLLPEGRKDAEGNKLEPSDVYKTALQQKEQIVYTGFIAQEVEAVAKEMGYTFSGVDAPKNEKDMYGLRYAEFVVPLVKAVQELSRQNDALGKANDQLSKSNDSLKSIVSDLQRQINEIRSLVANGDRTGSAFNGAGAYLKQNAPNPFSSQTIIEYYIPEHITQAQLLLTDMKGRTLQSNIISNRGKGQITITAGTLAAGAYVYSLVTDGKMADSKQLVITK